VEELGNKAKQYDQIAHNVFDMSQSITTKSEGVVNMEEKSQQAMWALQSRLEQDEAKGTFRARVALI
jgi:hypothetical protein